MKFKVINNFKVELAAELPSSATSLPVSDTSPFTAAEAGVTEYLLTIDDKENVEIIFVTAVSAGDLVITRGREGTTARTWAAGTVVESRETAGMLASMVQVSELRTAIGEGATATEDYTVAMGLNATASSSDSIALQGGTASAQGATAVRGTASGDNGLALGLGAVASSDYAIALMGEASGDLADAIAAGRGSVASSGVALGPNSEATGSSQFGPSLAVGDGATAILGGSAYGPSAHADGPESLSVGSRASTLAPSAIALGTDAAANPPYSVSIGHAAENTGVLGGMRCSAIQYIPATYNLSMGAGGPPPKSTRQSAAYTVVATEVLDLTAATTAEIDFPDATLFFVDTVDIVTVAADTAGGSPTIKVGSTGAGASDVLAASTASGTAVGDREKYASALDSGVSTLYVTVDTEGTGTTYDAKVVVHGYVLEV